jgi:hypothetical protein
MEAQDARTVWPRQKQGQKIAAFGSSAMKIL